MIILGKISGVIVKIPKDGCDGIIDSGQKYKFSRKSFLNAGDASARTGEGPLSESGIGDKITFDPKGEFAINIEQNLMSAYNRREPRGNKTKKDCI